MRDPNGIALQSVDPELSVQYDADSGASDLSDWASSVDSYGEATSEILVEGGGGYSAPVAKPCQKRPGIAFHNSKRISTPFMVCAGIAVVIVVLILIPD
jgi:hypothetical protein